MFTNCFLVPIGCIRFHCSSWSHLVITIDQKKETRCLCLKTMIRNLLGEGEFFNGIEHEFSLNHKLIF